MTHDVIINCDIRTMIGDETAIQNGNLRRAIERTLRGRGAVNFTVDVKKVPVVDGTDGYKYEAYYYNPNSFREDCNELSVNGKHLSPITSVRHGHTITELTPRGNDGDLILLIPVGLDNLTVHNVNPFPEEHGG